jgi:hypothetical protein
MNRLSMTFLKTTLNSLGTRLLAAVLLTASGVAQAQLHIDVSGVGSKQIPVAIANFAGEATPPQDLPQIVRDDLNRSGLFRTVDAGVAPLAESDQIDAGAWKTRGANAVVAGSARRGPNGQLVVRFVLFDVAKNQSLGGREFVIAAPNLLRLTAHKIADYVYEQLTGQKGVFSTHIAYVTRTRFRSADHLSGLVARWHEARLCGLSTQETSSLCAGNHDRYDRASLQLPRQQQCARLGAGWPHPCCRALARRQFPDLPDQRRWVGRAAAPDALEWYRHRAILLA